MRGTSPRRWGRSPAELSHPPQPLKPSRSADFRRRCRGAGEPVESRVNPVDRPEIPANASAAPKIGGPSLPAPDLLHPRRIPARLLRHLESPRTQRPLTKPRREADRTGSSGSRDFGRRGDPVRLCRTRHPTGTAVAFPRFAHGRAGRGRGALVHRCRRFGTRLESRRNHQYSSRFRQLPRRTRAQNLRAPRGPARRVPVRALPQTPGGIPALGGGLRRARRRPVDRRSALAARRDGRPPGPRSRHGLPLPPRVAAGRPGRVDADGLAEVEGLPENPLLHPPPLAARRRARRRWRPGFVSRGNGSGRQRPCAFRFRQRLARGGIGAGASPANRRYPHEPARSAGATAREPSARRPLPRSRALRHDHLRRRVEQFPGRTLPDGRAARPTGRQTNRHLVLGTRGSAGRPRSTDGVAGRSLGADAVHRRDLPQVFEGAGGDNAPRRGAALICHKAARVLRLQPGPIRVSVRVRHVQHDRPQESLRVDRRIPPGVPAGRAGRLGDQSLARFQTAGRVRGVASALRGRRSPLDERGATARRFAGPAERLRLLRLAAPLGGAGPRHGRDDADGQTGDRDRLFGEPRLHERRE